MTEKIVTGRDNNMQFCLLSALGMIFVVDGHLGHSFFDIGGLFQYYSFHMQLFVFISGYFYRCGSEEHIGSYIQRKFQRLMIPYFIWNLIYGLIAGYLRGHGFTFGEPLSLYRLFVEPFRLGYQFTLNHAAWFVPTLFLTETVHVLLVRAGHRIKAGCALRTLFCFGLGIAGIFLSKHIGTGGFMLPIIKVMFLLPIYSAGVWYRERLEERDKVGNAVYFSILIGAALLLLYSGKTLIYAVSHCQDFPGYLLPYATAALGIAFWLRVSRILSPVCQNSRLVYWLGRNTFPVMMHHMMAFFLFNTLFAVAASHTSLFAGFDFAAYKTDFYYCYVPKGIVQFKIVYLAAGIMAPLLLQKGIDIIRNYLKNNIRITEMGEQR